MKTTRLIPSLTLAISALFGGAVAEAAPCSTSDVVTTSIGIATISGTDWGTSPVSYSAAECTGADLGNAIPLPKQNLGYYGDGLFNGAPQGGGGSTVFPSGIFSTQYTAIDLNGDGQTDPGWIYLGKWTPGVGFETASIGGNTSIVLDSWFSITMTNGSQGTWSFTPDADVVSRVLPVLGPNLFDQFALSFMAGNYFSAYDFTGSEFGIPTSPDTIYNFSGTWDMSGTLFNNGGNAAGLSHVDLYVRDPNGGHTVPEPAGLALLGIGLAGLGWSRRNKK